jgi:hypothetical protein
VFTIAERFSKENSRRDKEVTNATARRLSIYAEGEPLDASDGFIE